MKKTVVLVLVLLLIGSLIGCQNSKEVEQLKPVYENLTVDLVYCSWDKLPEENQTFFAMFYDGDLSKGQTLYEDYFLKFNLIHEVSHTIQVLYDVKIDSYEMEQGANNLAVAYWSEVDPDFITKIEKYVDIVLTKFESPVPEGEDEHQYFVENYEMLGANPSAYGYYQFKFVKNALDSNNTLYESLKQDIHKDVVFNENASNFEKIYQVGDVEAIVDGYSKYLVFFGLKTPVINIIDEATPQLQFVRIAK